MLTVPAGAAAAAYNGTLTVRNCVTGCSNNNYICFNNKCFAFAPTISAGGPTTFCNGGSVTLSITNTYSGYQWHKNGSIISGETSQTYTATTAGSYTAQITNGTCYSLASSPITVTVNAVTPPTISAGGPTSFCSGGSVVLTSSLATTYQWYVDGNLITDATNRTLYSNRRWQLYCCHD